MSNQRILILGARPGPKTVPMFAVFKEKATAHGMSTEFVYEYPVEITYDGQNMPVLKVGGLDPKDFDLVYMHLVKDFKNAASLIANYCKYLNVPFINSRYAEEYGPGKMLQRLRLPFHGVQIPRFYFETNYDISKYDHLVSLFGNRFVAKFAKSARGEGVHLVESRDDFQKILTIQQESSEKLMYFEEFVEHDFTTRGIVTGDQCDVQITVTLEEGSFRTNWGQATFSSTVDPQLGEVCVKAAAAMGLQLSGVDTVKDTRTGEIKVLEVNQSPGMTIEPTPSPEIDALMELLKRYKNEAQS